MQPPARLRPPVTTAYRLLSVKQTAASGTREDLDPRRQSSRGSRAQDKSARQMAATRHLPPTPVSTTALCHYARSRRRVANESLRDKSSRLTPNILLTRPPLSILSVNCRSPSSVP